MGDEHGTYMWVIRSPVQRILAQLVVDLCNYHPVPVAEVVVLLEKIQENSSDLRWFSIVYQFIMKHFEACLDLGMRSERNQQALIEFQANDLLQMIVLILKESTSTNDSAYSLDDGPTQQRPSFLLTLGKACKARCKNIVRRLTLARLRTHGPDMGEFEYSHPCSEVRDTVLNTIFSSSEHETCDYDPDESMYTLGNPEVSDIDLAIPVPGQSNSKDLGYQRLPLDPVVRLPREEWRKHCVLRDYYTKKDQTEGTTSRKRKRDSHSGT